MAVLTPETKDEQDSAYVPESLRSQEGDAARHAAEAAGDKPLNPAEQAAFDQIEAGERERNPSDIPSTYTGKGQKSKWITKEGAKKHGPIVGIIITLLGGSIGIAGLASPSFLLMQIKETLLGFTDNATPALSIRTKLSLQLKANSIANGFQYSDADGKCNIRCKFGTMDSKLINSFEYENWTVEKRATRVPGRFVVTSITPPGEGATPITSGAQFKEFMRSSTNLALLNRVIDFRAAYYLNAGYKKVTRMFGLDKTAKVTGNTEDEVKDSIREAQGLDPEGEGVDPNGTDDEQEADRKVGSKQSTGLKAKFKVGAGKAFNIQAAVCGLYDVGRGISLGTKLAKVAVFASTAWMVLNITDMIMAGDNPSPEAVEEVAGRITDYQTNESNADGTENAYFEKSFTDSKSYNMAAYLDNPGELSAQEQKFAMTSASVGGFIGSVLAWVGQNNSAQYVALRGMCSVGGITAGTVGSCAVSGGVSSVIPVVGTAAGIALCAVVQTGLGAVIGFGAGSLMSNLFNMIIQNEMPNVASIVGGELGDASYSGISTIESSRFQIAGGSAATSASALSDYRLAVADETRQMTEVAYIEAKQTPYDINNQYSFLGSLVRKLGVVELADSSFSSGVTNALSLIPRSVASLISPVSADESNAAKYAALYDGTCSDSGLAGLGIACDAFSNPAFVMSEKAMNADINTTLSFMENTFIDEEGDPIPGTQYDKFVEYCVEREIPLGESEIPLTGDLLNPDTWDQSNYDWANGSECIKDDTTTNNFRTYTMDKLINDSLDSPYESGASTTPSSEDTTEDSSEDTSTEDSEEAEGSETPTETDVLTQPEQSSPEGESIPDNYLPSIQENQNNGAPTALTNPYIIAYTRSELLPHKLYNWKTA